MTWEVVKLGEICAISRGGSPRPIEKFITDSEDGLNWIKIGDVQAGEKYITKTKEKITREGLSKTRQVFPGDFLLSNSMSFGRPYILKIDGCIHDGWLVLRRDTARINQDYLYHVLSSQHIKDQFQKLAVGAVVKNLNSEVVRTVELPLPPLDEQVRISRLLDKAEEVKDRHEDAIRKVEELKQSLFDAFLN